MMPASPKILLFSRDPGGANTVIPLVEPIRSSGIQISLYGKDMALSKYRESGLEEGIDLMQTLPACSPEAILDFLRQERPDFVLTGTSGDDPTEKFLWRAAKVLGIPSAAILDQWHNYGVRFSPYGVSRIEAYRNDPRHTEVPDTIFVMDDEARQAMLALGFESNRVVVTGQPYFEWTRKQLETLTPDAVCKIREQLGISSQEFVLTFVSEPLSELFEQSAGAVDLGYTEKTIFQHLVSALEKQVEQLSHPLTVLIKLHPRENPDNYRRFEEELTPLKQKTIRFIVNQSMAPWETLAISNLVCGMSSMLLTEAFLAQKPVFSIQIGLKQEDPCVLSRRGLAPTALTEDQLLGYLETAFRGTLVIQADAGLISNPIENILAYLRQRLLPQTTAAALLSR